MIRQSHPPLSMEEMQLLEDMLPPDQHDLRQPPEQDLNHELFASLHQVMAAYQALAADALPPYTNPTIGATNHMTGLQMVMPSFTPVPNTAFEGQASAVLPPAQHNSVVSMRPPSLCLDMVTKGMAVPGYAAVPETGMAKSGLGPAHLQGQLQANSSECDISNIPITPSGQFLMELLSSLKKRMDPSSCNKSPFKEIQEVAGAVGQSGAPGAFANCFRSEVGSGNLAQGGLPLLKRSPPDALAFEQLLQTTVLVKDLYSSAGPQSDCNVFAIAANTAAPAPSQALVPAGVHASGPRHRTGAVELQSSSRAGPGGLIAETAEVQDVLAGMRVAAGDQGPMSAMVSGQPALLAAVAAKLAATPALPAEGLTARVQGSQQLSSAPTEGALMAPAAAGHADQQHHQNPAKERQKHMMCLDLRSPGSKLAAAGAALQRPPEGASTLHHAPYAAKPSTSTHAVLEMAQQQVACFAVPSSGAAAVAAAQGVKAPAISACQLVNPQAAAAHPSLASFKAGMTATQGSNQLITNTPDAVHVASNAVVSGSQVPMHAPLENKPLATPGHAPGISKRSTPGVSVAETGPGAPGADSATELGAASSPASEAAHLLLGLSAGQHDWIGKPWRQQRPPQQQQRRRKAGSSTFPHLFLAGQGSDDVDSAALVRIALGLRPLKDRRSSLSGGGSGGLSVPQACSGPKAAAAVTAAGRVVEMAQPAEALGNGSSKKANRRGKGRASASGGAASSARQKRGKRQLPDGARSQRARLSSAPSAAAATTPTAAPSAGGALSDGGSSGGDSGDPDVDNRVLANRLAAARSYLRKKEETARLEVATANLKVEKTAGQQKLQLVEDLLEVHAQLQVLLQDHAEHPASQLFPADAVEKVLQCHQLGY
eukprot:gene7862-8058_t